MNFLALVQRAKQECGISGDTPVTVTGLSKELQRLSDWVAQSYVEIQEMRDDWDFLRKEATFNTVAGQYRYLVGDGLDIDIDDFAKWRNDSFRSYLQSAGVATEVILSQYYNYSQFRDFYLLGSRRLVQGRPMYYTINPADRAILLGFTPNDVYVVSGEYYRSPHTLTAATDTPLFPSQFHMAIVYRTMEKYGMFESAQEQVDIGRSNASLLINRMMADQTPMLMMGNSLI